MPDEDFASKGCMCSPGMKWFRRVHFPEILIRERDPETLILVVSCCGKFLPLIHLAEFAAQ